MKRIKFKKIIVSLILGATIMIMPISASAVVYRTVSLNGTNISDEVTYNVGNGILTYDIKYEYKSGVHYHNISTKYKNNSRAHDSTLSGAQVGGIEKSGIVSPSGESWAKGVTASASTKNAGTANIGYNLY